MVWWMIAAREVGFGAEVGVADNVEVGEAGEAEGLAQAATAGAFEIDDEVGVVAGVAVRLVAEEEGSDERGFVFARAVKAVCALIGRVKGRVRLEDDVRLAGDPPGSGFAVREHGGLRSFLCFGVLAICHLRCRHAQGGLCRGRGRKRRRKLGASADRAEHHAEDRRQLGQEKSPGGEGEISELDLDS